MCQIHHLKKVKTRELPLKTVTLFGPFFMRFLSREIFSGLD